MITKACPSGFCQLGCLCSVKRAICKYLGCWEILEKDMATSTRLRNGAPNLPSTWLISV